MDVMSEVRPYHVLKTNVRATIPGQIVVVDTETWPEQMPGKNAGVKHRLRLGCATFWRQEGAKQSRRQEFRFLRSKDFWEWLTERLDSRRLTWLFTHNLGFDLTILNFWAMLEDGALRLSDADWPLRAMAKPTRKGKRLWRGQFVVDDPPTILKVRSGDKTLLCADTLNYWPMSLERLGKSIGVAKQELPSWEAPDEEWFAYCAVDTLILEKAMLGLIQWWNEGKYGTFKATGPGLAWSAFRHRFMTDDIEIHGHRKCLTMERDSYFGGECRSFFIGSVVEPKDSLKAINRNKLRRKGTSEIGPVTMLDVRGLYPWAMAAHCFPIRLIDYLPHCDMDKLRCRRPDIGLVAQCEISSDEGTYPVRKDGTVRYCKGKFATTLTTPEFCRAESAGELVAVGAVALYEMAPIFCDYVEHFWMMRKQAIHDDDDRLNQWCKLLLNSLYGKFAQRSFIWDQDPDEGCIQPWATWFHGVRKDGTPQLYRSIAWHTQRHLARDESQDSFPAIAAHVTAYARELMLHYRTIAGYRNVLYQDTDSLHVLPAGLVALEKEDCVNPDQLGCFKNEGTYAKAEYYGLKHYRLDGDLTCGAVRRKAKEESPGVFIMDQFEKLKSIIQASHDDTITVKQVSKTVSLSHPDGTIGPSGWVEPVTL